MADYGYGPFKVDLSAFERIPLSYEAAQNRAREDALREAIQRQGGDLDLAKLAQLAAQTGNISTLGNIAALAPIMKSADEMAAVKKLPALYGLDPNTYQPVTPGAAPRPPVGPVSAAPGTIAPTAEGAALGDKPRPKVASSDKVVGDDEAVAAGLYPPPATIGGPPEAPAAPATGGLSGGAAPTATPVQTVPVRPPAAAPAAPAAQAPPVQNPPLPSMGVGGMGPEVAQRAAILTAILPRLPPNAQAAVAAFRDHLLKQGDLTEDMKNYIYAARQAALGNKSIEDFQTWVRLNKAAQAGVLTSPEGLAAAKQKELLAVDSATLKEAQKQIPEQRKAMAALNQLLAINAETPGGWAGPVSIAAAKIAETLGLPTTKGMNNAMLMQAITRSLVPGIRDPGATSNVEQQMYIDALPNLLQSKEGRELVAKFWKSQLQRNAEIINVMRNNLGKEDLAAKLDALEAKSLIPDEADRKLLAAAHAAGPPAAPPPAAGAAAAPPTPPPGLPPGSNPQFNPATGTWTVTIKNKTYTLHPATE